MSTLVTDFICQILQLNHNFETMCDYVLNLLCKLTQSTHGYICVIEKDTLKYISCMNLEMYVKKQEIQAFNKSSQDFLVPNHLREKWMTIPLRDTDDLIGAIGIENNNCLLSSNHPLFDAISFVFHEKLMVQRSSTQQDIFLSSISHEIRTPLNGIVGMGRLLKESIGLNEEQKCYISVISQCTYQLLELINDILDFSKMNCDQLELHIDEFDIKQCFDEVCDLIHLQIQEKKLNFILSYQHKMPQKWKGDKKRIRQILLNVIQNAIKFTEKGHITVNVSCEMSESVIESKQSTLHIEIADTGIGIPEHEHVNVFKNFHQIRSQKPNTEGVGLGLAICKKLSEMMNGTVKIKWSVPEKGTCVVIQLPLQFINSTRIVESAQMYNVLKDKVILIIDCNQETRVLFVNFALSVDMRPLVCSTLEESHIYVQNVEIDAVIIVTSNEMNVDLLSCPISKLKGKSKEIPSFKCNIDNLKEKLLNYFLKEECNLLHTCSESNYHESPSIQKNICAAPIFAKMNILIVEDNIYNMMVITETLKKLGHDEYRVEKAVNGAEAIQKAIAKHFDAILMDLLLPTVDGFAAAHQILNYHKQKCQKAQQGRLSNESYVEGGEQQTAQPIIIALTAMITNETQSRCKQLGFSGFLTKPLEKEDLEVMLLTIARRKIKNSNMATDKYIARK
jgi:two-component system sensor histidine kinase/response regulator